MAFVLRGTHPDPAVSDFEEFYPDKAAAKVAIGARLTSPEGWYTSYMTLVQQTETNFNISTVLSAP